MKERRGASGYGGQKNLGPPLGFGSPGRRVSFPVSFSHRSVGSSILASLSEAGGNDLQRLARKPLPPRSPFPASRQTKRTHTSLRLHAPGHPLAKRALHKSSLFYCLRAIFCLASHRAIPKLASGVPKRNSTPATPPGPCLQTGPAGFMAPSAAASLTQRKISQALKRKCESFPISFCGLPRTQAETSCLADGRC